ncbi:hypothetical protein D3C78_1704010 [compost metagenome]
MWERIQGEHIIDIERFISDILQSINNFAHAMDIQVKYALHNPIENVVIDKSRLLKNNNEFLEQVKTLKQLLSFNSDQTDWTRVLSSINQLKN